MKNKGTLYEQIFFHEALARNYEVFTPLGDYLPQDCLVMNQAGKIYKVQIKGTADKVADKSRGGMGRYMITTSAGAGCKKTIDPSKVDILAAYVAAVPTINEGVDITTSLPLNIAFGLTISKLSFEPLI